MIDWAQHLKQLLESGASFVMITIVEVRGSAPREVGARLFVTREELRGTIGGGHVEYQCVQRARELLQHPPPLEPVTQEFQLGASLGQCCGGALRVLFETYHKSSIPSFAVFGAGHLGKALIPILAPGPCQIHWIDDREGQLGINPYPQGVVHIDSDPVEYAAQLSPDVLPLIVTHSHALDFDLCRVLLNQPRGWVGLIGSRTKALRFRKRLEQRGVQRIDALECPVGDKDGFPKHPAVLAIELARTLWLRVHQECVKMSSTTGEACHESA